MVFLGVVIVILAVALYHLSPSLFGGRNLRGPSNGTVEVEKFTSLKVILLGAEWGSSKGGLSTFNRHLAINLQKQSKINVFCYLSKVSDGDKKAAKKDNVTLVEAEPIPGNTDALAKLQRLPTKLQSADVIISHGPKFGSPAYHIKDRYNISKWIHFVHVDYEEIGKNKVGKNEYSGNNEKDDQELDLCKAADVAYAVGPKLWDRYSNRLQKKVEVFYPGLIKEFGDLSNKTYQSTVFHVIMFCRCTEEDFELKGVDLIADVVGKLREDYDLKIVGVAKSKEKEIEDEILNRTRIKKSQLFVREYINERKKMGDTMYEADLVVMPSRTEAFGLTGLEALSAGVPLLVSSASGLGMTLKNLTFGDNFVVESDDAQKWEKRIESVKKKKRSQRVEEVKQMRDQYEKRHNWKDECSRLVKLFLDD